MGSGHFLRGVGLDPLHDILAGTVAGVAVEPVAHLKVHLRLPIERGRVIIASDANALQG
jgi:hypothetical protein